MESTYDVFGAGDLPTFWPSFLAWGKKTAKTRREVGGSQYSLAARRQVGRPGGQRLPHGVIRRAAQQALEADGARRLRNESSSARRRLGAIR